MPSEQEAGAQSPPQITRLQRKEKAACDALKGLIRECHLDAFGVRPPSSDELTLSLQIRVRHSLEWALDLEPPLVRQIEEQLAEAHAAAMAYHAGRVHCFRCRSSDCEHSAPPAMGYVFKGYSSTGVPEWWELVQALIEMRDERAEQLYEAPPRVLACVQFGHDLKAKQLSSFGRASRNYSILAQCVCGYYTMPGGVPSGHRDFNRLAVTFQAVETRDPAGRLSLRLNTIPSAITLDQWQELIIADAPTGIGESIAQAEQAMADLAQVITDARSRGGEASQEVRHQFAQVPHLMRRLARAIEQRARQSTRRTHHAQERRAQRPVHKALDDAVHASDESIFFDERQKTFVVCGPHGRAHVFNDQGRHVTTFRLPPGSLDFRIRTQRWRRLNAEELQHIRAALARVLAADQSSEVPV
jgi:hypothetical protein